MNRRNFLKRGSLLAASGLVMPYILPSGRLFAKTMSRKVNHVVFCLFAGGIRNIESVHQNEGNLMPALLRGQGSTMPGLQPVPRSPRPRPLQEEGTLFKEMRYAQGPTGHFNGHTVAITGQYTNTGLNLQENPQSPTVFEYYLKHNSPSQTALNAWWISNALGPYPALNYSKHPSYGAQYGANHLAPTQLFAPGVYPAISNPKQFQFHEEEAIGKVRNFLNDNFSKQAAGNGAGIVQSAADRQKISDFTQSLIAKAASGGLNDPIGMPSRLANNDVYTITFAEEVISEFKPELLAVNMTDVDVCHQNYTQYCNNLRKADYAVAHLWSHIQSTPGMANDTVMVIIPEHGRNLEGNSIADAYGRFAIDHTSDPTSREIFGMILGPPGVIAQNKTVGTAANPVGETIDMVPTIANLLGFDAPEVKSILPGRALTEAFA
ncbi:MAG: alkaline phosphatase family protein [Bacteroidota bacterium]